MQKHMQKLALIPLLIGLNASAFAAINSFDPSIKFPEPTKGSPLLKAKFYANESDLNQMTTGLNKEQVRILVGSSQLHASIVTAQAWTYVFKFTELDKRELVCQYQIQFDEQKKVSGSYFDSQACVDHLHPPIPGSVQVQAPAPLPLPDSLHLTIPTNMLFGFNQSTLKDLPESVKETLRTFSDQLKSNDAVLGGVTVTGYTDRIGDDAYNLKLSTARAQTIKDYLALRGVDAAKITVEGKGSSAPLVQCPDTDKKKLIDCLATNRRVDIEYKLK